MYFSDSKFYNIKNIDCAFRNYIKDLNFNSNNDLVQNAVILENFFIQYFDFNVNFDFEFSNKIKITKRFIDHLNKCYERKGLLYKKYSNSDKYLSQDDFLNRVYFRSFIDFKKNFELSNDPELHLSFKMEKCDANEDFNNYILLSKSDHKIQFSVEFNIYTDELSSYILSILHDDLHLKHRKNNAFFNLQEKIDYKNLIGNTSCNTNFNTIKTTILEPRLNDFNFHWQNRDERFINSNLNVDYCLKCHKRDKDSCRKGLINKNLSDENSKYQINQLDQKLHGCPLDEHISEAIMLQEIGCILGSLSVMMINNPLLVLTGYRICNDCAKSCIFQNKTPVDVPYIETTIFDKIINLPFGVEIYLLLTQWNPLNFNYTLPKKKNNKKVLVVGLGPAGISASYFLLRAGFEVIALEAAKVEKLKDDFVDNVLINFIEQSLEERIISGFGGVMEYGITSRWNKNYLTIVQLMLERHENFNYYDGIKFGSNYFLNDAFEVDKFDHVVIASGAGKQDVPKTIQNFMTKNIRFATDFLMNLQLGGAYKLQDIYIANSLQYQLPAVVLGGGLTAIDTASEVLNYYPRQVLKIDKYVSEIGLENVLNVLNTVEAQLLNDFLCQAKKIKECFSQEDLYNYIDSLGGVTVIYHKKISYCNAYKVNHEELNFAIQKGVKFIENAELNSILVDNDDAICSIKFSDNSIINVKSLFIACGCSFNPNLFHEIGLSDEKILKFIHRLSEANDIKKYESSLIDEKISVIGDMNPQYKGSVVKAILNGKLAANEIYELYCDIE